MSENIAAAPNYTSLYKFLSVLDENQIHKLHKVVSGLLDVSVFSSEEIDRLEQTLSLKTVSQFMPMNSN